MNRAFLLVLAVALALLAPASADDCVPSTSEPEISLFDTPAGTWYADVETCQPDCPNVLRVYEESNGIEGLQRSDWIDDTCGGLIEPDTLRIEQDL